MVGNSKNFYAGYLTTNKATCKVSWFPTIAFLKYYKIFILGSEAECISTLTPGQIYKRADEIWLNSYFTLFLGRWLFWEIESGYFSSSFSNWHTDIKKMYNTIHLKQADWSKIPEEKIIKTLIYGVHSSGNVLVVMFWSLCSGRYQGRIQRVFDTGIPVWVPKLTTKKNISEIKKSFKTTELLVSS